MQPSSRHLASAIAFQTAALSVVGAVSPLVVAASSPFATCASGCAAARRGGAGPPSRAFVSGAQARAGAASAADPRLPIGRELRALSPESRLRALALGVPASTLAPGRRSRRSLPASSKSLATCASESSAGQPVLQQTRSSARAWRSRRVINVPPLGRCRERWASFATGRVVDSASIRLEIPMTETKNTSVCS